MIRLARPTTGKEEAEAVAEVLTAEHPWLTNGPRVEEFERKCRDYLGASWTLAVSSATAGLHLAFDYYRRVQKREFVVMPAFTFVATANAAIAAGLKPVFVDVNPETFQVTPNELKRLDETMVLKKSILCPVLYGGYAGDVSWMENYAQEHGLPLVWDAAHAFGSREPKQPKVGATRFPAVFSFYPSKNLTTGEGGLVASGIGDGLAPFVEAARNHGQSKAIWKQKSSQGWDVPVPGHNFRMSELHAAIGIVQLRKYANALKRRRAITARLREALTSDEIRWQHHDEGSNAHLLAGVMTPAGRQFFIDEMENAGIEVGIQYPAVHRMEAYGMFYAQLPETDTLSSGVVTIPNYQGLTASEVKRVGEVAVDILMDVGKATRRRR